MTSTLMIADPDLEAVRVAATALVSTLKLIVHKFMMELTINPARFAPSQGEMRIAMEHLNALLADAEAKLAGIRDADAKLGLVRDDIIDLIELAGAVRDDLALWLGNSRRAPNEVHKQLAAHLLQIVRFAGGPRSGIDYGIREADRRWGRKPKPRVACDPTDRSVWLDGRRVVTDMAPPVFGFFQAVAKAYPDPITYRKMKRTVPGLLGKHPKRDLKDKLPVTLSELVKSGKHGYQLELPPRK